MRVGRVAAAVVLAFGLTLASVAPAAADELLVAIPDARQELSRPPGWVTLAFDLTVDEGAAKILVTNSRGESVTQGAVVVEDTNMSIQLEFDLPKDTYTVRYRVNRSDGEVWGGAYQFAYGQGSFADLTDEAWSGTDEEPTEMSGTDDQGNPVETAEPEPTPTPEPEPTETATTQSPVATAPTATTSAGPPPTPTPAPPVTGVDVFGTPFVLAVLGGIVAVAAAIGIGYAAWRQRRGPRGSD